MMLTKHPTKYDFIGLDREDIALIREALLEKTHKLHHAPSIEMRQGRLIKIIEQTEAMWSGTVKFDDVA